MNSYSKPRVAIFLATHNSEKFLRDQIDSILDQVEVQIFIYVSDDSSVDSTYKILSSYLKKHNNIKLLKEGKFGNAHRNFMRLIKDVELPEDIEFIALADHDDIWKRNKIIKGISKIEKNQVQAYSGSFEIFTNNSSQTKYFSKNQNQKKFDHIFSSPGPGSTFILKKEAFRYIQDIIRSNYKEFLLADHHDWILYSLSRTMGVKWTIDEQSYLLYRQHDSNQIGANNGKQAYVKRINHILSGKFNQEINRNIYILSSLSKDFEELVSEAFNKSLSNSNNVFQYRRSRIQSVFIYLLIQLNFIKHEKHI